VVVNARLFNNPATSPTTEMNFFEGVTLIVDWRKAERVNNPAGLLWTGGVRGVAESQASMVVSGKNVSGNITRGDGLLYEVRTTADGRQWVIEVDQKQFPRESEPLNPNKKPI
jgi:hypothetical protein